MIMMQCPSLPRVVQTRMSIDLLLYCPPAKSAEVEEELVNGREFDFLINGELIRGSLEEHITQRTIPQVSHLCNGEM